MLLSLCVVGCFPFCAVWVCFILQIKPQPFAFVSNLKGFLGLTSFGSLRLVVCTKHDIVGALILNHLLPRLDGHQVMVLLSNKTRDAEIQIPELKMLKFLERDLPLNTVFPLVDAQGPQAIGTKLTFQGLSQRFGIPFHVVDDINSPHWSGVVRDFSPDIMTSVRFSNVFKPQTIEIPRLGTFNIHPGALPKYAGLFPSFRALLNQERQIGCTLHRVDRKIDGGPILGIGWTQVQPERGLLWHVFKSYYAGLDLFVDVLPKLASGGGVEEVPQDVTKREYRSLPQAEDVRRFVEAGLLWFDPDEYSKCLAEFMPSWSGDGLTLE